LLRQNLLPLSEDKQTSPLCGLFEGVLNILPNPNIGPFTKEDGQVIIDKRGKRIA
jgi:arsenate reductase (glutaredoxin)